MLIVQSLCGELLVGERKREKEEGEGKGGRERGRRERDVMCNIFIFSFNVTPCFNLTAVYGNVQNFSKFYSNRLRMLMPVQMSFYGDYNC